MSDSSCLTWLSSVCLTGIKKDPAQAFVPRTVMIGGKVSDGFFALAWCWVGTYKPPCFSAVSLYLGWTLRVAGHRPAHKAQRCLPQLCLWARTFRCLISSATGRELDGTPAWPGQWGAQGQPPVGKHRSS